MERGAGEVGREWERWVVGEERHRSNKCYIDGVEVVLGNVRADL